MALIVYRSLEKRKPELSDQNLCGKGFKEYNESFRSCSYFLSLKMQTGFVFHLLTFPMCYLKGDRGYEGPKGSRGPPGVGYKGDKVRLMLNTTENTDTRNMKTSDAVKDLSDSHLSDLSPV